MTRQPFNLAGSLTAVFAVSKLTPILTLAVLFAGLAALFLTPREENPQIIVPAAQVSIMLPGATAEEVERLIVTPLEGRISEISGVDHTYAVAAPSYGQVTVQFKVGEDKEAALTNLFERVLRERNHLPPDASEPVIQVLDVDDVPIVSVALVSKEYDEYALKRVADRVSARLRSIESVSVVNVYGGVDREVRIEIDPERLSAFAIPINRVRDLLSASNVSLPAGKLVTQGRVEIMRVSGFIQTVDDLGSMIVGQAEGRPVFLSDIAEVIDGPITEREAFSRFAFGPADTRFEDTRGRHLSAVSIGISKRRGSNAVVAASQILDRIERLRTEMIPQGVDVIVTRDDGQKANASVNALLLNLLIASLSVFVVLTLFLGWREATIVAATVPLALALTFVADLLNGVTLNRVTFFAIILSLGMLVDAAIVVVENIHRRFAQGAAEDPKSAAIAAVAEIGNPTNLATFAIMLVFASLATVTGMAGQYFYPVTFNVPVAIAASLLAAYIFAPWAACRWLRVHPHSPDEGAGSFQNGLRRRYLAAIMPLLDQPRKRWIAVGVVVVLIALSVLQPTWQFIRPQGLSGPASAFGVAMGFLPKDDKNTFLITIEARQDTPVELTDALTRDIENVLAETNEVTHYQTWIGQTGVPDFNGLLRGGDAQAAGNIAEIRVNLIDKRRRSITSIELVRQLRKNVAPILNQYEGAVVHFVEDPPGPPVRATVLAEIYGHDPEVLQRLSSSTAEAFKATFDMVEVDESEPSDVVRQLVLIDRNKAALSGVTPAEIARTLRLLVSGETLGQVHMKGERNLVPIVARVPRARAIRPDKLDEVFVENSIGQRTPLSEFISVRTDVAGRPILRKNNERVVFVGGELSQTAQLYAVLDLDRRLEGLTMEDGVELSTGGLTLDREQPDSTNGYQLLWDGEIRLMLDVYRDMFRALAVAILAVYLLLLAYYKSFVIPFIAMSALPAGLIGIFPGHWLLGADFSATSMIGIVALSGVVVRNALLIIDYAREKIAQGVVVRDAVCEAGAVRVLPIMLTILTTILGAAMLVPDPVFGGLGISLIFGSLAATVLTVFIVPLLLYVHLQPRQALHSDAGLEKA